MSPLTAMDRIRLSWFMTRLDYHLADLPKRRRREIRHELRVNTREAAHDAGMREAITALGHPRVLAEDYVRAEGRPLPHYTRGAIWAALSLGAYVYLVMAYSFGLADGATSAGTNLRGGLPGTEVAVFVADSSWPLAVEYHFSLWVLLLPAAVFVLASQLWRLLPPWRKRQP